MSPFYFSRPAASFPGDLAFKAEGRRASQIYHLLTIVHGEVINPLSGPRRWPPQSSVSSIIRTGYRPRRGTKPPNSLSCGKVSATVNPVRSQLPDSEFFVPRWHL